jgi:hypothetical protein
VGFILSSLAVSTELENTVKMLSGFKTDLVIVMGRS